MPPPNPTQSGATRERTVRNHTDGGLEEVGVDSANELPTRIDHADTASPRDSGQHDTVVGGIVFMVYAKRLRS